MFLVLKPSRNRVGWILIVRTHYQLVNTRCSLQKKKKLWSPWWRYRSDKFALRKTTVAQNLIDHTCLAAFKMAKSFLEPLSRTVIPPFPPCTPFPLPPTTRFWGKGNNIFSRYFYDTFDVIVAPGARMNLL